MVGSPILWVSHFRPGGSMTANCERGMSEPLWFLRSGGRTNLIKFRCEIMVNYKHYWPNYFPNVHWGMCWALVAVPSCYKEWFQKTWFTNTCFVKKHVFDFVTVYLTFRVSWEDEVKTNRKLRVSAFEWFWPHPLTRPITFAIPPSLLVPKSGIMFCNKSCFVRFWKSGFYNTRPIYFLYRNLINLILVPDKIYRLIAEPTWSDRRHNGW